MKRWEKYYKKTQIKKIPWNHTQADYFMKLLQRGEFVGKYALDLGCGVGKKSIELAKIGFNVTAVDISQTAIKLAKENARKARVSIRFIQGDATDLLFLGKKQFDFVLDWANLHGIAKKKQRKYVRGIVEHMKKGGKLLLRCFSKYSIAPNELGFITPVGNVYIFSEDDIKKLYGKYFTILKRNRSKPFQHTHRWFDEYLMERL
jgi:2-polyprenyl-3-methyl-5-hydroxy-6-metoxy-1,4-benzoquinol methylase